MGASHHCCNIFSQATDILSVMILIAFVLKFVLETQVLMFHPDYITYSPSFLKHFDQSARPRNLNLPGQTEDC